MIYLYLVGMLLVGIIIGFFFGRAQALGSLRAYLYAEKQLKAFDDHVENEITLPDLVAKYEDRIPGFSAIAAGLGISKEEFAKALLIMPIPTGPGRIEHRDLTGKKIIHPWDRVETKAGDVVTGSSDRSGA